MFDYYKRYYKTVFDIALIIFTVYMVMWVFSYIYNLAKPIIFALVIFAIIEPFAMMLHRRGIKKSIASALSILLLSVIILGALVGVGYIFTNQINNLAAKIPQYAIILQGQIDIRVDQIQKQIAALPPDLTEKVKEYATGLAKRISDAAVWFLHHLFTFLSSFSSFVINFVIAIILAYFLSIEIDQWKKHAHKNTPRTMKAAFFFLKENVLIGMVSYIKAQLKLVSVTFLIIFVVLLVLRVPNSFSIALLSGFFDLLPLLGVSTVFIPWIIYLFIVGDTTLAILLTILLGVVLLFRQILEPKITGDSLGVSAFTTLSFMIISLSLFGISGLILSPILIILIKALHEKGYLKRWIRLPEDEY